MVDEVKISALPAATTLTGAEVIAVLQGSTTVRTTADDLSTQLGIPVQAQVDAAEAAATSAEALVAPHALSFARYHPIEDLSGLFGGGQAVYLPRLVYYQTLSITASFTIAGSSTELPTHRKIVIPTNLHTVVWLNLATRDYEYASYDSGTSNIALPTTDLPNKVYICTIAVGAPGIPSSLASELPFKSTITNHALYFTGDLVYENGLLKIPPYYYYGEEQNGFELNTPAVPATFTANAPYFVLTVTPAAAQLHMHDQRAKLQSLTPVQKTVASGQTPNWLGIELARTLNNTVQSIGQVVGDIPGGCVPNQCGFTPDPTLAPGLVLFTSNSLVSLTSDLTALGLTKGVGATAPNPTRVDINLVDKRPGASFFARIYVKTDTPNNFDKQLVAIIDSSGTTRLTVQMELEEQLSTTLAIFKYRGNLPNRADNAKIAFANVDLAGGTKTISVILAGPQFHSSGVHASWILRNDIPVGKTVSQRVDDLEAVVGNPSLDLLVPPDLFLIQGKDMPLFVENMTSALDHATNYSASINVLRSSDHNPYEDMSRDLIKINPSRIIASGGGSGSGIIAISQFTDDIHRYHQNVTFHIAASSGQSASPNMMLFGDSIGNRNIIPYIITLLSGMGFSATAIGTINNNGGQGEAREGRSFTDFTYETTTRMAPVASGSEATYTALSDSNKVLYNPYIRLANGCSFIGSVTSNVLTVISGVTGFVGLGQTLTIGANTATVTGFIAGTYGGVGTYNLSTTPNAISGSITGAENATYVKNGYIFDLLFGIKRFSLANPTDLVLALGTNDTYFFGAGVGPYIDRCLDIVYHQSRLAFPNLRIWPVTYAVPLGPADVRFPAQATWWRRVANFCTTIADPLLRMIPGHLHQSAEISWPTTVVSTDADFGSTYVALGAGADITAIHPEPRPNTGQDSLANIIAAGLACGASGV